MLDLDIPRGMAKVVWSDDLVIRKDRN